MTTIFNSFKCGLTASLIALGAVALTGCSNELAEQQQAGAAGGAAGATEVEIVPSFVGQVSGLTRAADNLNTSTTGFSSNTETARIFVDGGSYDATFTEYAYTCSGTTMTASTPAPTFPVQSTVTSVNVYGWYPALDTSKSFSIQADQSTDANYEKSDLMLANQVQCEREVDSSDKTAWRVKTAAALQFHHVMAKAKITFRSVDGTKITAVKLKNIKPTVAIEDATKTALALGSASGTAGDVTLWTGEKTDNTDQVACGVFPPQSIAANTNFIEVVTDGGSVYYTVGAAAKAFDGGKEYAITIEVGSSDVNHTVSLGNWTHSNTVANFYSGSYPEMATTGVKNNPLWYVAQYNSVRNGTANSFTMLSDHRTDQKVYNWTDFNSWSAPSGYHKPSKAEQIAIVPTDKSGEEAGTNLWTLDHTSSGSFSEIACTVKKSTPVAASTSVWYNTGSNEYHEAYAVRFINTDYASAWHYKFTGSGFVIESFLIKGGKTSVPDVETARVILKHLPGSVVWNNRPNETPENTDPASSTFVQRYIPACGYQSGAATGGVDATTLVGKNAYCWSTTAGTTDTSKAFYWGFGTTDHYVFEYFGVKAYGLSVRLFHD